MDARLVVVWVSLFFLFGCFGNCSADPPEHIDLVQLDDDFKVAITESDQACTLRYLGPTGAGSVGLLPSPPCRLVLDWQGRVKTHSYDDLGPGVVAVVIGTPIEDPEHDHKALLMRADCGAQIQGVVFRNNGVFPLPQAHDVVRCADNGVDEREFWSLSH